ncbi:MAG TPA: pyrimidine 5'-nucleotidase [Rhodobacteraceae bacterium]|jgi:putative hydrolase of the HAD superfamily|nr:pyrimidine 5'-nucleotidase [Paracoccaceae bacterium]HBR63359.1 pyrimidine 5'-nucleotidase [Paracoccaceae bacterium]|tara:strand:+ start:5414 stop:6058 length:645 start_codon:yes stop_codon:yes gene_type:complete
MLKNSFCHVTQWVFDLDNTLYPPEARLFDQIEVKMSAYVMASLGVDQTTADQLRRDYWRDYGTTLAGLMREHNVDPGPYLFDVHDIDLSHLNKDPALASAIDTLPGRKIVYTNGTAPYARQVLAARGLDQVFEAVYGVEEANFLPKPELEAFETIFALDGIQPRQAAMFEDEARNLQVPHSLGMQTIHVAPAPVTAPYLQHHTNNLRQFLELLV